MKKQSYDKKFIIENFEKKIVINEISNCWEWSGTLDKDGYGLFGCCYEGKPKLYKTHRLSYIIYNRPISKNLLILHKCNNAKCVNPDHLYEGTHLDNMKDLRNSGNLKGKNNPNYGKITSDEKKNNIRQGVIKWYEENPDFNPAKYTSKQWRIIKPNGEVIDIKNLTNFCKCEGLHLTSGPKGYYIKNIGWEIKRL